MSITVTHLSKTFGHVAALQDVSLHVATGEFVALLGPSGSGKTTLLRIIAGLDHPDAGCGSVHFHGHDVTTRHVRERGVGFVFQHYALFRHMLVFDNVAFGLRVLPRRRRPARAALHDKVHQLLRRVQLDTLAERYPHQLSGGQRQRVALARALAVEPRVLLLDEPFGALDAQVRKELRTWLRRLHDDLQITSVLVTHDQDEAFEVADRVVLMHHGRIEQTGTPDDIFHRPRTEFVMHFLGQANCFHGRIEEGKAVFGPLVWGQATETWPEGATARLLVRPQDVQVETRRNGAPALPAQVTHLKPIGAVVKVECVSAAGQTCSAEIPYGRFLEAPITPGSQVFLGFLSACVFIDPTVPQTPGQDATIAHGALPR